MENYLISSSSYYLAQEKLEDIIKDSKNVIYFNLTKDSLSSIINEAAYISFLPDTKYIVVKNANIFTTKKSKDEDNELLLKYLNDPNDNVVMIFVILDKLDNRKKITKLMNEKYKLINIPLLNGYELEKKIKNIFNKDEYKIDMDTIKYVISTGLNNYDLIYNEILKIKNYYAENKQIMLSDVKNISAINLNDNIFKFINAAISKDINCFSLLDDLKILKEEPIMLITLLSRDYRNLYIIKNLSQVEAVYLLELRDWQYQNYLKNVNMYTNSELKKILHKLYELDFNIKTGKIDKYLGLEMFLLDII